MVESMVKADIGSWTELALRYTTVILGGFFMTIHIGSPVIAIWLIIFLALNGYYSFCLTKMKPPTSRTVYMRLTTLFITSVIAYSSCAVYVFLHDDMSFRALGVTALVAQGMFNLSRHRHGSISAIFDTVIVALAGLIMGFYLILQTDHTRIDHDMTEDMIIVVCTIGVCSYYVIAQYRNIQTHVSLRNARIEAIQTQKMKAVGQITAGVAHDFNNLLTVIRGNIELAELAEDPEEVATTLKDAKLAADRAADLTSQLLSFSRKARLEASKIDLVSFWSEFGKIMNHSVPATIETTISANPDLRNLFCDRGQLQNAVLNLLINARDALQGRGKIEIYSRRASVAEVKSVGRKSTHYSAYGAIEIRDNGAGIPPDLLDSVTEPFFTTKKVGQGSGLGLSMVKGFTEQSGGNLLISSSPRGTRVVMVLPTDNGLAQKLGY
ncbi:hypothetical protein P775_11820 [Puniceibacterium antarcticum]|uniref:histidine kinase n=2 Tax=Puniceibacterium antarcticum TaxID=1206336 RepID=A0A2G8REM2_9RHOB|nr:hypothetical protein P775_11820 [Puniceibacterium antarcticum]